MEEHVKQAQARLDALQRNRTPWPPGTKVAVKVTTSENKHAWIFAPLYKGSYVITHASRTGSAYWVTDLQKWDVTHRQPCIVGVC